MPLPPSPARPHLVLHRSPLSASTRTLPQPSAGPALPVRYPNESAWPAARNPATLTIDGIPHTLFDRIAESAAANHRSIVGEVIARLESGLGSARPTADSTLARVRAIRNRLTRVV